MQKDKMRRVNDFLIKNLIHPLNDKVNQILMIHW